MHHPTELASLLAGRLREAKNDLVTRWLERIHARVTLNANEVFPSETLLNHVPLLIDGIATYLENPGNELDADDPVGPKAMELGALRHEQGFDAYEILKELEILGGIIFSFLDDVADEPGVEGHRRDFLICWQRVAYAIEMIRQATMTHFLRLSSEVVNEREERLRRFNRMVAHELKNRVGAIRGAAHLMGEEWLSREETLRFQRMVLENSEELHRVLGNLESLSRIETDSRRSRNVLLPQAAAEAVRQLREMSQTNGIDVEIAETIPSVEVDAAAVELCLVNYISNAIKYSDPEKQKRTKGSGLGLNIVRETVESLGGRAWAEFPEDGETVFAFAVPSRRAEDAASAGTKRPADNLLGASDASQIDSSSSSATT